MRMSCAARPRLDHHRRQPKLAAGDFAVQKSIVTPARSCERSRKAAYGLGKLAMHMKHRFQFVRIRSRVEKFKTLSDEAMI